VELASLKQARLVGEVPVEGHSRDPGLRSDGGIGRVGRPDRRVQIDRRTDDLLPRLVLALCPPLQPVLARQIQLTLVFIGSST
jgi:hypothetical protein